VLELVLQIIQEINKMKKQFTRDQLVDIIKSLDKRAETLTDAQLDIVMNDAYGELTAICNSAFSDEAVVSMSAYYDADEKTFTIDIEDDVIDIYDLYVTIEGQPISVYQGGVIPIRDEHIIYRDSRESGRAHINLNASSMVLSNAIIKYYYVPQATDDTVYLDGITMSAYRSALNVALSKILHDTKRAGEYLVDLERLAQRIPSTEPEDVGNQCRSVFASQDRLVDNWY